jgi:hypothetical protein
MEVPQSGFWIAIVVGGALIAAASAAQQMWFKDPQEPSGFRIKAVARDFFIGSFLAAIAYMFLPESIQSWVTTSQNAMTAATTAAPMTSPDVELQTGPARF